MRLITLECPKSNAQLDINPDLTSATCNYCGCHFLIDDEARKMNINFENSYQMGYEFERGKSNRRMDEGHYCAVKIRELMKPISDLNYSIRELSVCQTRLQDLSAKENALFSVGARIGFYAVLCGSTVAITAAAIFYHVAIYNIAIILLIAGLVWASDMFLKKVNGAKLREQIEEKTKQCVDINGKIESIYSEYDIDFIPPQYRHEDAMEYFYNVFSNQRAMNMQQAINLYEDELHKNRMEALQKEQIEMQKQQLVATRMDMHGIDKGLTGKALVTMGGLVLGAIAVIKHLDDD